MELVSAARRERMVPIGHALREGEESAVGKREPGMPVPDAKQAVELTRLKSLVAETRQKLAAETPELTAAQAQWWAAWQACWAGR